MKRMKTMGAALLAVVLASSCSSTKNTLQTSALNGEWNITTVNGKAATAENDPFLGIDLQKKRMYGCAGCNRINASVEVDETKAGQVAFGQVMSTRMLCQDMETETAVLQALNNVSGYKGTEEELTLTDAQGNALLTLSKRPAATLASLEGKWNITKVYGETAESIEKTDKMPFLEFDTEKKTLHGNAGCNIVNGGFEQEKGRSASLKFDKLLSTMMAGPGMTLEGKVLEAMNKVKSFNVKDEHTAVLLDENGEEALTLTKE